MYVDIYMSMYKTNQMGSNLGVRVHKVLRGKLTNKVYHKGDNVTILWIDKTKTVLDP